MDRGASRHSPQLTEATKDLYSVISQRNLQLVLSHVSSSDNEADRPSRRLSALDATLSPRTWALVERMFGGISGHTVDMMALDSNAQLSRGGTPLPHFTPCSSPQFLDDNLFAQDFSDVCFPMANPYTFPPFGLIGAVIRFLTRFHIPFTIVVPEFQPTPY
jgi:hypothetical protein